MTMNHEQFEREKNYRLTLAITKTMLSEKIITEHEYRKIDTMLVEKYRPILGSL